MSSVLRDVLLHDEPLEDAAELRVALLVAAQIGREVVEGAHRAADVGQRQARRAARRLARPRAETSPGTVRMLERTPAWPAVTQNEVPPRIENSFGLAIGK